MDLAALRFEEDRSAVAIAGWRRPNMIQNSESPEPQNETGRGRIEAPLSD
jgi:hypothetical protein